MRTKILTIMLIGIFISGGCLTANASSVTPVPEPSSNQETMVPPKVETVVSQSERQLIPTPPVIGTPTPVKYEKYEVGENTIEAWMFKDPEEMVKAAVPLSLALVAIDGPLPVGDIIAVTIISGSIYYLVSTETQVYNPDLPQIPEIDWPGIKHAAEHRGWPIMFTLIVYACIFKSPDGVFYGPASGRIVMLKYIEGWALIGLIFSSETNLLPDPTHLPIVGNLITIVINAKGNRESIRLSDCASWQVAPIISYDQIFEPPPTGGGTCLRNGNYN